jgi:hypothetical protein
MVYRKVSLDISRDQLKKAADGKQITLSASQLKSNAHSMHVHPSTHEKITKAVRAGRGCRIHIAKGEIEHDLAQGGSLWSWLRDKAVPWVKNTLYPAIKPAISGLLDAAQAPLAEAAGPYAPAVIIGRKAIRSFTGAGIHAKGSQAAKDRMAAVRAKRKVDGGSVLYN